MTRRQLPGPDPEQGDLFDVDALRPAPQPLPDGAPSRTRGQIRIERQGQALAAGWHPLALTSAYRLRLHPDAAPADDRTAPGRRCGTCRFRVLTSGHARSYPKCRYPDPDTWPGGDGWPRETDGDGTDVRSWWPACTDHQTAGETPAAG